MVVGWGKLRTSHGRCCSRSAYKSDGYGLMSLSVGGDSGHDRRGLEALEYILLELSGFFNSIFSL